MVSEEKAGSGPAAGPGGEAYGEMIVRLRAFLDAVAGSRPDAATIEALSRDIDAWARRLGTCAVGEAEQIYSRRGDLVGRGQVTLPAIRYTHLERDALEGLVTFGRYFLGRNGVVHGGVVMLVFDEVAGRLAHLGGRSLARTAYMRSEFRAVAPVDVELAVSGRYTKEEGRKRLLRLELRHGDILCAEAEALMVALRPGQP